MCALAHVCVYVSGSHVFQADLKLADLNVVQMNSDLPSAGMMGVHQPHQFYWVLAFEPRALWTIREHSTTLSYSPKPASQVLLIHIDA